MEEAHSPPHTHSRPCSRAERAGIVVGLTDLDMSSSPRTKPMTAIKISSKVEEGTWRELREHARENNQSVSGLLTEAIAEYLARRRVRPSVLSHLEDSMRENEELGRRLAK